MKPFYVVTGCLVALLFLSIKSLAQAENNTLDNKIVIVVHMQEIDSNGKLSEESSDKEIKMINQIIEHVNPENVAYSKAIHKILNITLKKIYTDEIIKDLDNRINVVNENVFVDHGGDVFNSDELNKYLKERDISQIVLVGRVASECLTTSALTGEKLGYDIFIIPDAIIGKSEKSKTKAINKLKAKGVEEISVADYQK
ncbi:MAG: hypothetical protein C0597_12745 [Marinilabiliales bacterium]|nr:MAG: hypothetical protein C0597_12745 [Marinilabiliales bacterium]